MQQHKSRKFSNGSRKVDNLFSLITGETFKKFGFANYKVISDWPFIIGARLAQYSVPQRIDFPPEQTANGVLYIAISNPGLALEIQANEGQIVNKLATYFGYRAIGRIKIIIDKNAEKKPLEAKSCKREVITATDAQDIEEALAKIKDEKLKNNLNELFATLFEQED